MKKNYSLLTFLVIGWLPITLVAYEEGAIEEFFDEFYLEDEEEETFDEFYLEDEEYTIISPKIIFLSLVVGTLGLDSVIIWKILKDTKETSQCLSSNLQHVPFSSKPKLSTFKSLIGQDSRNHHTVMVDVSPYLTEENFLASGASSNAYKVMVNGSPYVLRLSDKLLDDKAWEASKKLRHMVQVHGNFQAVNHEKGYRATKKKCYGTCLSYAKGYTMSALLDKKKTLPSLDYYKVIQQMWEFCTDMRKHNLFHGDMNANNMILDEESNICFIDFNEAGDPHEDLFHEQRCLGYLALLKLEQKYFFPAHSMLANNCPKTLFDFLIQKFIKRDDLVSNVSSLRDLYDKLSREEVNNFLRGLGNFEYEANKNWINKEPEYKKNPLYTREGYIKLALKKNLDKKQTYLENILIKTYIEKGIKNPEEEVKKAFRRDRVCNYIDSLYRKLKKEYVTYLIVHAFPADTAERKLLDKWNKSLPADVGFFNLLHEKN